VVCVGFATSRIGLVVHEFVGHGGATLAMGGDVTDVHLFAFAGGWVRYRIPAGQGELVIAMGGIVVESVIGGALWIALARRPPTLTTRIVRGIGCALVVHATWYLATGTWHGYGDGSSVYRELGDSRWIVAMPAGLVTCAMAFAGARHVLGALANTIGPERRVVGAVIALVLAGGVQLGSAITEVRLRDDTTYISSMRPERDRIVAREMARWETEQARRGAQADAEARRRMREELARKNAVFPFIYVLGGLVVLSTIAGAWRAERPEAKLPGGLVTRWAVAAGASIALVIAIDALFH
jgi:hypothetical protein